MAHSANLLTVVGKVKVNKKDLMDLATPSATNLPHMTAQFWVMLLYREDTRGPWNVVQPFYHQQVDSELKANKTLKYEFSVELPPSLGHKFLYFLKAVVVFDPVEGEPPDGPTLHRGDFQLHSDVSLSINEGKKKLEVKEVTLYRRQDPCNKLNCVRCANTH